MQSTRFHWGSVTELVADRIDSPGMLFGIPANPCEFLDFPGGISRSNKHSIASSVVDECLERAKTEIGRWFQRKIEKDGVDFIKAILKGESVFGDLLLEH